MNRRIERVNAVLRQEISRILATELKDPRISSMVSVIRVDTTPGLRSAKVYVSVLGDQTDKSNTIKALRSGAGFVRKNMRVTLRSVPVIEFHLDETIEQGANVLNLINKAARGSEATEAS